MTVKEKVDSILNQLVIAKEMRFRQGREIIVRLSYELFCELIGKTQLITGVVGYQHKFAGYDLEVYSTKTGEQSFAIYYKQAEGWFEGERR